MKEIKDYIVVLPNIVPDELCDALLNEYKNCDDWVVASTGSGKDIKVRNCETIGLSFQNIIDKNKEVRQELDDQLFKCASEAIKQYNSKFIHCEIEQDSGYDLLRYSEGSFYITHIDSFRDISRSVSCSFALNEDYEGGEFAFFDRELRYSVPKGSAIMFPSNFMYPHEILPVTSGTRYSIVTWFV